MSRPDLDALRAAFAADLDAASDPRALDSVRRKHTGRKSPLKAALRGLRDLPPEERPRVARAINALQDDFLGQLESAREVVEERTLQARLDAEWQDLSLPGLAWRRGERHVVTQVERRTLAVLRRLGLRRVEGPEVETAFHNFDALNIPEHHPARDMQDTFWIEGNLLLRSHTTTVQARTLAGRPELPIKIASTGRVYRNEAVDATHLAMFHQLEGLWIDRGITMNHLHGVLRFIARELYGEHPIRFKPKYYPYTEPSVGVDLQCTHCHGAGCDACHEAGWVTILGSGMVHPKLLETFGYPTGEVTGIAFGLGISRMASQWASVQRVRSLYEQDLRVHRTVHRGAAR